MLGRLILLLLQIVGGWFGANAIMKYIPNAGQFELFIFAVCCAIVVFLIGVVASLVLKEVGQPSSHTLSGRWHSHLLRPCSGHSVRDFPCSRKCRGARCLQTTQSSLAPFSATSSSVDFVERARDERSGHAKGAETARLGAFLHVTAWQLKDSDRDRRHETKGQQSCKHVETQLKVHLCLLAPSGLFAPGGSNTLGTGLFEARKKIV